MGAGFVVTVGGRADQRVDGFTVAALEFLGTQLDLALEHGVLPCELVLEALHSQQVLQAELELQAIDRPGKKVIRPLGQPLDPGLLVLQRRNDDDGQRPRALLGAEPAGHLEAVHARHHHVEDDEIHRPLENRNFARVLRELLLQVQGPTPRSGSSA